LTKGKKATALTAIALLTTGLTACNGDQGALENNNNNQAQPMGYYTNEGNGADNEGPVTEMMDGMNGENNRNYFQRVNNRYDNRNMSNPTVPLGNNDNGLVRDNRYSHGDANYHHHLNEVGYYNRGDGEIAQKVKNSVEKMDNVEDARVIVTDDNVLVAIDTNDRNDKDMKQKVTKELQKMSEGRNIQVYTDDGTFTRIRNIDNDIQNAVDRDVIDTDVNELLNDLGDAVQRPFNNNR